MFISREDSSDDLPLAVTRSNSDKTKEKKKLSGNSLAGSPTVKNLRASKSFEDSVFLKSAEEEKILSSITKVDNHSESSSDEDEKLGTLAGKILNKKAKKGLSTNIYSKSEEAGASYLPRWRRRAFGDEESSANISNSTTSTAVASSSTSSGSASASSSKAEPAAQSYVVTPRTKKQLDKTLKKKTSGDKELSKKSNSEPTSLLSTNTALMNEKKQRGSLSMTTQSSRQRSRSANGSAMKTAEPQQTNTTKKTGGIIALLKRVGDKLASPAKRRSMSVEDFQNMLKENADNTAIIQQGNSANALVKLNVPTIGELSIENVLLTPKQQGQQNETTSSVKNDDEVIDRIVLSSGVVISNNKNTVVIESPRMHVTYVKSTPKSSSSNKLKQQIGSPKTIPRNGSMTITPRSRRKNNILQAQQRRQNYQQQHPILFKDNVTFYMAVKENNIDKVREMLDVEEEESATSKTTSKKSTSSSSSTVVDINFQYSVDSNQSALHIAAKQNNSTLMELLILNGAILDSMDNLSRSPLHLAAQAGHHEAVVLLLSHGAAVNIRDTYGNSPYHLCIKNHHFDISRDLILFGADVNFKKLDGVTGLHEAMMRNDLQVVQFYIDLFYHENVKVLFNIRCEKGDTVAAKAIESGHKECLIRLLQYQYYKSEHPLVNLKNENSLGHNIFHVAAMAGKKGYLEWLVKFVIENHYLTSEEVTTMLNQTDKKSASTPLILAAKYNAVEAVRDILNLVNTGHTQVDVNAFDSKGNTALHQVVKRLINISSASQQPSTPGSPTPGSAKSPPGGQAKSPKFDMYAAVEGEKQELYELICLFLSCKKVRKSVKAKGGESVKTLCKRYQIDLKAIKRFMEQRAAASTENGSDVH